MRNDRLEAGGPTPPRAASFILRLLTSPESRASVLGDFEEIYADLALTRGPLAARAWYGVQVLKSLPMFFANLISGSLFMFKTDFKLAVRNILGSKGFSFLNIAGLALGMAVSFLMLLFVRQETSFDRFHEKSGRIYRFSNTVTAPGRQMEMLFCPHPFGPLLKETFPEVLNATRLEMGRRLTVTLAGNKFDVDRFLYADPSFFEMFTSRIVQGEAAKMLAAPFSLVLTDETAARLFDRGDPVGKALQVGGKDSYTVTGVVKKMPRNSHIQFDALVSMSTRERTRGDTNSWMKRQAITYLELDPNVSPLEVLPKFQKVFEANTPAELKALIKREVLELQPLTRIHLYSRTGQEISAPGNPAYLRILTLIALFILLLAGINFITLSTARAGRRAKEVGIRKVLGAERRRLVFQFLGESVLLSVISLAAAAGLIYLILPVFNRLIVQNLRFQPFESGIVWLGLLGLTVVVGLLAGLYPALVLAGFSPQNTLKSQAGSGRGRRFFRHGLVTFQYVVSIALVCCTLIVQDQLRFLKNYDLGYDKDQLLELPLAGQLAQKRDVLKTEVLRIPGVESATLCNSAPMRFSSETVFVFEGAAAGDRRVLPLVFADGDYLPALGLTLSAGRNFDKNLPTDRDAVILNETLVRQLGWTDPLGKTVKMLETDEKKQFIEVPLTVIGVVHDYYFESLHAPLRGQVIVNQDQDNSILLAKLRAGVIPETLTKLERAWKRIDPSRAFNYTFLSESFDRLYRTEQRLGKVFLSFTLLALFVAGLGLFGLAAFTAERRTKEVGIRKVLGASVPGVMVLLARDFVRWVLLANIIAWPVAFLAMKNWMRSFAYRAEFNPLVFLASGALALVLAVVTVSLKTARAAAADPVQSLRCE